MFDLISIIMPVRNGLPFLDECLQSIISQSYTNWELIVVNDHSEDATQSALDRFAASDRRIVPIKNNGRGIIDALRSGYIVSNGTYITRMDADDIMPIQKIESLHHAIKEANSPSVATGHIKYFSESGVNDGYKKYETWLNQLCINQHHFENIYKECVIPSPCWMMQRDHFDQIGGFNSNTYPEDYDLCFRMYKYGINVVPVRDILHLWRDHGSRTSRNDENYADNRFLELKLEYFCQIEVPKRDKIVLLGAGKKGKTVAKHFINEGVDFAWFTNNPKKIGVDIYDKKLLDYDQITTDRSDTSYVISVANKEEQVEIQNRFSNALKGCVYFFC